MVKKVNYEMIRQIFFDKPSEMHRARQIARECKMSHPAVLKYLKLLEKEQLIIKKQEGYSTNTDESYKWQRKINVLGLLYSTGLVDFLKENCMPNLIAFFGSASKGEDDEKSDIDIFIEGIEKKINLANFEKKIHRKINLTFGQQKKLSKEFKESIANGIILFGAIQL